MSFYHYLLDKRFFLGFYVLIMVFISSVMLFSIGDRQPIYHNIVYANAGCLFFLLVYLAAGYAYRRVFFLELKEWSGENSQHAAASLAEPQNHQQAIYLELLRKLSASHTRDLQESVTEQRDHQDFILSWIHEVKLPIAASRLLMSNSPGKSVEYIVDKLEDELAKIDNYVEQVLYYSRIDSFSKDYFITEVQLGQRIKESVKKYAKLFINKNISLQMNDMQHFIQSDSKWLSYIIDQITANALKYTPDGGAIVFSFEEDNREKRLLISDTGIGISAEDVHRVFDKGFTGTNGRIYAKSTGMGLYLARQMARKLGHDLSIRSEEGTGTEVTIHIPKLENYYRL
ncbi:sensor histidine kinase [Paenibacillus nasutitermitis]|uniref:histidine kinase n=1 Tax=Paenibacillus nasutitermitis TaxID=1652958 RepID=A0A916YYA2_9BACL|nr:sensor histidine kinase [Paenibacillus nasutitermitis]GGD66792.1 two-component sensor histidine kinase [Paenibacillus nasutitermitis]